MAAQAAQQRCDTMHADAAPIQNQVMRSKEYKRLRLTQSAERFGVFSLQGND
jgi:hypothetical protein